MGEIRIGPYRTYYRDNSIRSRKILGKKISQNRPSITIGRFVITEHTYKDNPVQNHLDLFLYFSENSYLITYKLPKNTKDGYGIRQKDHKLKYLAYEGKLKESEHLRIEKRGYCITHNWIFSHPENNYAKITYEDLNGSLDNMWKKTDFKIALDEIVLYEVNDEKHVQTDKHISSTIVEEVSEEKTPEPQPEVKADEIQQPAASVVPLEPEAAEPSIEKSEPDEVIPAQPESPVKPPEEVPEQAPAASDEEVQKGQPETREELRSQEVLKKMVQPDEEISFAPIKEMVLSSDGKSEEEYDPS